MKAVSFKLIFRSWWRNKTFAIIAILSLAVGIACTNLLAAFVIHEYNVEPDNPNKDRMVVVKRTMLSNGFSAFSIPFLEQTAQILDKVPELDASCKVYPLTNVSIAKWGRTSSQTSKWSRLIPLSPSFSLNRS